MNITSTNIRWHQSDVTEMEREQFLGKGAILWFTGLSGSGKSTVARALEAFLVRKGISAYVLDGDNLRFGLNKDLGFSAEDRQENIRRVGEVAKLISQANVLVLAAFISPYQQDRTMVRELMPPDRFLEIHVATSVETCAQRDPKGLYAKAQRGEITNFTGISAPYEAPENPELRLDTAAISLEESVQHVYQLILQKGLIAGEERSVHH